MIICIKSEQSDRGGNKVENRKWKVESEKKYKERLHIT